MFKLEYNTSLVNTRTTRRSVREYDDYSAAERVTAQKTMATRRKTTVVEFTPVVRTRGILDGVYNVDTENNAGRNFSSATYRIT